MTLMTLAKFEEQWAVALDVALDGGAWGEAPEGVPKGGALVAETGSGALEVGTDGGALGVALEGGILEDAVVDEALEVETDGRALEVETGGGVQGVEVDSLLFSVAEGEAVVLEFDAVADRDPVD